ncbi:MAG: 30S ribosomal protein S15 [Nitrososphaerales archaeon]|nr:30S ribosomal protein S15 [Nitrososphaerales archaeon]
MTRIHGNSRGKSQSMKPSTMKSDWVKLTPEQIGKLVVEMNKEGLNASQIGIKLRDEHAISSIKSVTGKTMKQFMEENGINQEIPEDLEALVKRALSLQNHLKSNKGDRKNVRSLELLEAKVHRLSKYYKKKNIIPKNWKYKSVIAQLS